MPQKLILKNDQSPGDLLVLSAAIRDLHQIYPGQYMTDVRVNGSHSELRDVFANNPYIASIKDGDTDAILIKMEYDLIHQSNQCAQHFVTAFHKTLSEKLGRRLQCREFRPDIHLTPEEKSFRQVEGAYWVIDAGHKTDISAKAPIPSVMQAVVDKLKSRVQFVQIGNIHDGTHIHPLLRDVIDLRGKTTIRQLFSLVYNSQGVLTPVSFPKHIAAGLPMENGRYRPCVVIAGNREPDHWVRYPGHTVLSSIGTMDCCRRDACWKAKPASHTKPTTWPENSGRKDWPEDGKCYNVVPVDGRMFPACIAKITADEIVQAIEKHLEPAVVQLPAVHDSENILARTMWRVGSKSRAGRLLKVVA